MKRGLLLSSLLERPSLQLPFGKHTAGEGERTDEE